MTAGETGRRAVTIALQTDKSGTDYAALTAMVEDLGFDGLSVFADLGYQPPAAPLAVAARASSRLRLGVACQNPVLVHPVEIAGQVATLDEMSGGRAYLGLARGAWLDGLGTPPSTMARLADAVEIIRRLLAGDDSGYQGTELGLPPGLRLRFAGHRAAIDLLIGTWGRRTAQWAASIGATEIKIGGSANPDMVRRMRSWLSPDIVPAAPPPENVLQGVSNSSPLAGRSGETAGVTGSAIVAGAVTVVDEDREVARAAARREVAMYLDVVADLDPTVDVDPGLLARLGALVAADDHVAAGALIGDDLLDRFAFAGSPDDVAGQAAALFEAGAARVEFGTPHGLSPAHGIELLGRHVLPALSEWRSR